MRKTSLFFLIFLIYSYSLIAQEGEKNQKSDSAVVITADSVLLGNNQVKEIITETPRNYPNKIALYSAILPGLGQIKNGKAWKLPIIYGSATALIFGVSNYNTQYKFFEGAFFSEIDTLDSTVNSTGLNEAQLRRRVEFYRRNRDLFYIFIAGLYLLNIVDAHVDAHLKDFDVNDELALSLKPAVVENPWNIPNLGVSLQLKVKP